MKKLTVRLTAFLILLYTLPQTALAARTLVPVGRVVGLELRDGTVTVAGFSEASAAQSAGLKAGDRILAIDGRAVGSAQQVHDALEHAEGSIRLRVLRGQQEHTFSLTPAATGQGKRLGVYLKEGITGIGTVTYFDPATGSFGALGHGVTGSQGSPAPMTEGRIFDAEVASVRKGKAGSPGQLVGRLAEAGDRGILERNTEQGVFGTAGEGFPGTALEIAPADAVKTGKATILSNVDGKTVQEYSVEILKIYPTARKNGRNLLLRVTDPRLLETTGGIVQGMSGSPILQNGTLVGAVTHV